MGGVIVRMIGLERARVKIGLKNLSYNMRRLGQLRRLPPKPVSPGALQGVLQPRRPEPAPIYVSNFADDLCKGASGKRVPGYEIELRDMDGRLAAPGEAGTMWVRGDSQAPFYWNQPEKTAETMRDDWIYTRDRFTCDAQGFYHFDGRTDDLIKVSGQWIYPLEIERCLNEHPDVQESCVLDVSQPDGLMTTKAWIVLKSGAAGSDEITTMLRDHVKSQLLPYKYPRLVEYQDDLPKTGTGKIDHQQLQSDG